MNYWTLRMNIFRRRRASASVALVLASFFAFSASAATLKIATLSPDGSFWMDTMRDAGKRVEAATDGRVKFKFYPGGVMGDDYAVLRKIRVGQLQGGIVTTGVFGTIYPDAQVYNLPMVFKSLDEVDAVRQRMDARLFEGLEDKGFVPFGFAEVGMAHAMSQRYARTVEDGRGLKVWSPEGDQAAARALQAFGISPIPLTIADVLGGLQTGLIDTVASPPVAALALQWHTRIKYVLDVPMMYIYGIFVVSDRHFSRIDEADRAIVRDIMSVAVRAVDAQNRLDHQGSIEALVSEGIELIEPTAEELASWQVSADRATSAWVDDGVVSREIYDELRRELRAIRAP